MVKRLLIIAATVTALLVPASAALAEPIELGCNREIVVRVYGVACVGADWP